jgi:hypothetical protein
MALASVVMLGLALPGQAAIVEVFTDRSLWTGSLTNVQTADFNEVLSNGTFQVYNTAAGYDPAGILKFIGQAGAGFELVRQQVTPGENRLRGPIWYAGDPAMNRQILAQIAADATGFGVDISSSISGVSFEILVMQGDGTETRNVTTGTAGQASFFGVTTDSVITSVTIRMTGPAPVSGETEFYLDNAATGDFSEEEPPIEPSEVPETSTYIYGATGLLLLAWTRHRRPSTN